MEKLKDEIIKMLCWAKEQGYISQNGLEVILENTETIFQKQEITI